MRHDGCTTHNRAQFIAAKQVGVIGVHVLDLIGTQVSDQTGKLIDPLAYVFFRNAGNTKAKVTLRVLAAAIIVTVRLDQNAMLGGLGDQLVDIYFIGASHPQCGTALGG